MESNKKYSASLAKGDEGRPPGASLKEIITKWFSSATSGAVIWRRGPESPRVDEKNADGVEEGGIERLSQFARKTN